jgi:hypothetical protein
LTPGSNPVEHRRKRSYREQEDLLIMKTVFVNISAKTDMYVRTRQKGKDKSGKLAAHREEENFIQYPGQIIRHVIRGHFGRSEMLTNVFEPGDIQPFKKFDTSAESKKQTTPTRSKICS